VRWLSNFIWNAATQETFATKACQCLLCLQGAIQQRKEEIAADHAALHEVLAACKGAGVHPLNRQHIPAKIKQAIFQLEVQVRYNREVLQGCHELAGI
jgi:hypothetical protein